MTTKRNGPRVGNPKILHSVGAWEGKAARFCPRDMHALGDKTCPCVSLALLSVVR